MKNKVKKPSGIVGELHISPAEPKQSGFRQVKFPEYKEPLEKFIIDQFLETMKKDGSTIYSDEEHHQNSDDPPDFFVGLNTGGQEGIELMETTQLNGIGFDQAEGSFKYGDRVEHILKNFRKKVTSYRERKRKVDHLLIYPLGYQFSLNPQILKLLSYLLHSEDHEFEKITYFEPHYTGPVTRDPKDNNRASVILDPEFIRTDAKPVELEKNVTPFIVPLLPHPQWNFDDFDEEEIRKLKATVTQKTDLSKDYRN